MPIQIGLNLIMQLHQSYKKTPKVSEVNLPHIAHPPPLCEKNKFGTGKSTSQRADHEIDKLTTVKKEDRKSVV